MPNADLRSLQRLAAGPRGSLNRRRRHLVVRHVRGVPAATRRPTLPRWAVMALVIVSLTLGYLGMVGAGQAGDSPLAHAPAAPAPDDPASAPRRDVAGRADRGQRDLEGLVPRVDGMVAGAVGGTGAVGRGGDAQPDEDVTPFAEVDGVTLGLPHGEPVIVAFHEASRPDALELTPVGTLGVNHNATKYSPPGDREGPAYEVLSSRGRARPATSAVDVVVPSGTTAYAPVSGTVVEVREYLLYGNLRDWRVVLQPEARPDLHVVLIHLHEPALAVGDRVTAGASPVAIVRQLPFTSHVDYAVGERLPHLHLEVRPATESKPHDPNQPAMDPEERLEEVTGSGRGTS